MQPQWEVADVLRHTDFSGYGVQQQKTLRSLKDSRTAALGGHVMHVMAAVASASVITVAGTGIAQSARDIKEKSGFNGERQTFCPALIFI